MPSRRRTLSLLASLCVPGCAGLPTESRSTTDSTDTETERSVRLDCSTVEEPPNPTVHDDEVPAQVYPSLPNELDADAAASFAAEYEAAYVSNRVLHEYSGVQSVPLRSPGVDAVEPASRGYLVRLQYAYGYGVNPDDEVSTEVAVDSPRLHVVYHVGDGVIARTEVSRETTLANVSFEDATVFDCES